MYIQIKGSRYEFVKDSLNLNAICFLQQYSCSQSWHGLWNAFFRVARTDWGTWDELSRWHQRANSSPLATWPFHLHPGHFIFLPGIGFAWYNWYPLLTMVSHESHPGSWGSQVSLSINMPLKGTVGSTCPWDDDGPMRAFLQGFSQMLAVSVGTTSFHNLARWL